MYVTVTDTTGTATVERSEVADTIRPLYRNAPARMRAAIEWLQTALDHAPTDRLGIEDGSMSTAGLCAELGVNIESPPRLGHVTNAASATAGADASVSTSGRV